LFIPLYHFLFIYVTSFTVCTCNMNAYICWLWSQTCLLFLLYCHNIFTLYIIYYIYIWYRILYIQLKIVIVIRYIIIGGCKTWYGDIFYQSNKLDHRDASFIFGQKSQLPCNIIYTRLWINIRFLLSMYIPIKCIWWCSVHNYFLFGILLSMVYVDLSILRL